MLFCGVRTFSMETAWKLGRDVVLVAFVAIAAYLMGRQSVPARAGNGVDHNRDMIAVTGEFGAGTSVLYLVDTRQKTLLVYQAQGGSQSDLKFVAARNITYDLKVSSYNDATETGMSVEKLERLWRKSHGRKSADGAAPGQRQDVEDDQKVVPVPRPDRTEVDPGPSKSGGQEKRESRPTDRTKS